MACMREQATGELGWCLHAGLVLVRLGIICSIETALTALGFFGLSGCSQNIVPERFFWSK